jgi:hypothetical protein
MCSSTLRLRSGLPAPPGKGSIWPMPHGGSATRIRYALRCQRFYYWNPER